MTISMLLNISKPPSTNICKTMDLAFHFQCPQRLYTTTLLLLLILHCHLWTCKSSTVIRCWRKPCSHYLVTAFLVLTSVQNILFIVLLPWVYIENKFWSRSNIFTFHQWFFSLLWLSSKLLWNIYNKTCFYLSSSVQRR